MNTLTYTWKPIIDDVQMPAIMRTQGYPRAMRYRHAIGGVMDGGPNLDVEMFTPLAFAKA